MFDIDIKTDAVAQMLQRIGKAASNATPLMRELSSIMHGAVEENFAQEGRPRWLGLKPETIQQRVGNKLKPGRGVFKSGAWSIIKGRQEAASIKILQRSGRLEASITPVSSNDTAEVGTNVVYAAIQNSGGTTKPHVILPKNGKALAFNGRVVRKVNHPGSKIPARPFMVLADSDGMAIEEAVVNYLRQVVSD